MRLEQIEIKDYNQFEHLDLDLTYPKGHKKVGLPLDKICIIGDNGTGKTTILKRIKRLYNINGTGIQPLNYKFSNDIKINKLLYFPTGPDLSNMEALEAVKKEPHTNTALQRKLRKHQIEREKDKIKIYDLSDEETLKVWKQLRKALKMSFNEEMSVRKELFTKAVNDNDVVQIRSAVDKLENYKKSNPNGLEKFKKFIDKILNRFHLELNIDIDLDKIEDEFFLKIKAKSGETIPIINWSTGIRQLVYNLLPLYGIETGEDTLILIDEPERSLYPNTQKILIDFYTGISPKSQFIFATHSPIIAAQFEPWEIIDLRFNEKGKVERKLYYDPEKGNHVDNYFIHPMYLKWDSLFELMFGLDEESNPKRIEKLMELAKLDGQIKKEKNKEKKKEMWKDYKYLANLLDWKTNGEEKQNLVSNAKN